MCETIRKSVVFGGAFIVETVLIPFHLLEDAYYRADKYMNPKKRW